MFNYDWWHGPARQIQTDQAKLRCLRHRFPECESPEVEAGSEAERFLSELEVHTVIYLRDGFSYEVAGLVESPARSYLICAVTPVEESWQVGGFVVSLPFEEITRIEIFAIHPSEKPRETPHITGFRAPPESGSRE